MLINVLTIKNLIAQQFPQYIDLPLIPVKNSGNDNRTFHLGTSMLIRCPSKKKYSCRIVKEFKCLSILSERLDKLTSISMTKPIACGKANDEYPYNWLINTYIEGDQITRENIKEIDLNILAKDLGTFLNCLYNIPINIFNKDELEGLKPSEENFFRGGNLENYTSDVHKAVEILGNSIDNKIVYEIWNNALQTVWNNTPVIVHGDISWGNTIIKNGTLNGIIDWGQVSVGDPACDLVVYWILFDESSRKIFRDTVDLSEDTWKRARAWCLWKGLIILSNICDASFLPEWKNPELIIKNLLNDHF